MKLGFGILAILIGLFFLWGVFRGLRPRYNQITRLTTQLNLGHLVTGILLTVMFCGTGILLLIDFSLWWILLPIFAIAIPLWSRFYLSRMRRQLEERLSKD